MSVLFVLSLALPQLEFWVSKAKFDVGVNSLELQRLNASRPPLIMSGSDMVVELSSVNNQQRVGVNKVRNCG